MDFEAKLESFYTQIDLGGRTVLDVGANVGRHTIPLARQVGSKGVVHAFEPIPVIRSALVANTEREHMNNVVVYPFALSHSASQVQFHYIPNLPEESGIKMRQAYNSPPEAPQLIDLHTKRLDDIGQFSDVAFIKIDIEGGELDMLNGALGTLKVARPIVAFECGANSFMGYHDRPQDIFSIFTKLGFVVFSILGERIENERAFVDASFKQIFWDYIALPAEQSALAGLLKVS